MVLLGAVVPSSARRVLKLELTCWSVAHSSANMKYVSESRPHDDLNVILSS
jgi:hypothetical protein